MIRELKEEYNYARVITIVSALSLVFGFASCYLGEILLPLASSAFALLFLFEKPDKRILSYVCPLLSALIGVLVKGFAAFILLECVLLGFIMAFCYKKMLSKAETSIYLTLTIAAFMFISLYLSAAVSIGSFSFSTVENHYVAIFSRFRKEMVELLSGFTVTDNNGAATNAMSTEDAAIYLKTFTNSFIAVIAVLSFLIAGLSLKVYSHFILKFSKHGILKTFAHFIPSNFCAYVYVISSLIGIFCSENSLIGLVLLNANMILMAVFGYMGLKYLIIVAKLSPKKLLVYFIIIFGFVYLPSVAPSVISYLGVWVVIGTNNHNKIVKDK